MEYNHGNMDTMERLNALYAKRDEDYKKMENIFNQREAQLNEKEKKLLLLSQQLDEREKTLLIREEKCTEKEKTLEERSRFLHDKAADLDKKIFEHEASVYRDGDRVKMLEEEAKNELMAAKVKKEEYKFQLSMLGDHGSGLLDQISSLEQQIKEKDSEIQSKNDNVKFLKEQLSEKDQIIQEKEDQLAKDKKKIADKNLMVTDLEKMIEEKEAKITELQDKLAESEKNYSELTDSHEKEMSKLQDQINAILADYQKRIADMADIVTQKETLEELQSNQKEQIKLLEEENSLLREANQELQSQKADLFRQLVSRNNPDFSSRNEDANTSSIPTEEIRETDMEVLNDALGPASLEAYLKSMNKPAEILHNKYGELVRTTYKNSTIMFCFEEDDHFAIHKKYKDDRATKNMVNHMNQEQEQLTFEYDSSLGEVVAEGEFHLDMKPKELIEEVYALADYYFEGGSEHAWK